MVFGLGGGNRDREDGERRGREPIVGTGRGGAGNMLRSPSRGRNEDTAAVAAKAAALKNTSVVHSGRGGAGNVRSPSRDPKERLAQREAEQKEQHLQEDYLKQEMTHSHLSGRGGAGNRSASAKNNLAREDSLDRNGSRERGRGRATEKDSEGGTVGNILRSLSRSRSREPRGSSGDSPHRGSLSTATGARSGSLARVNELESVTSQTSTET